MRDVAIIPASRKANNCKNDKIEDLCVDVCISDCCDYVSHAAVYAMSVSHPITKQCFLLKSIKSPESSWYLLFCVRHELILLMQPRMAFSSPKLSCI